MIQAILIVGGDSQTRLEKAQQTAQKILGHSLVNNPDFFLLDEKSIKIIQIRDLKKKLALKPYYTNKRVAFISEADRLTVPAQNALLKTLEEPPGSTTIILSAPNRELLLPTIVSRCQVIQLSTKTQAFDESKSMYNFQFSIFNSILTSSPGKRLLISEKYTQSRDEATNFCQVQLITLRGLLENNNTQLTPLQIVKVLRQIQTTLVLLKANVNPRLVLENLLLSYPKSACNQPANFI